MIEQEPSNYSAKDNSSFVERWENHIEKVERNRKIMNEGKEAVYTFRLLGLLKDENCGDLRQWDHIPK
mgnify:FL=1